MKVLVLAVVSILAAGRTPEPASTPYPVQGPDESRAEFLVRRLGGCEQTRYPDKVEWVGLVCAGKDLNTSTDPVVLAQAIARLEKACGSFNEVEEVHSIGCLHLGDAYSLGLGVPEDHVIARDKYDYGCNSGTADWANKSSDHWVPRILACRRRDTPSSLFDQPAPFWPRVSPEDRLARARSLADAEPEKALWLAASVARSTPGPSAADGNQLLESIVEKLWQQTVQPSVARHHYVRAEAAAKRIMQPLAAADPRQERLRGLMTSAAAYHVDQVRKVKGDMVTLHTALAHRFNPAVAVEPGLSSRAEPLAYIQATLGEDCAWLGESLAVRYKPPAGTPAGLPVRFALRCTSAESNRSGPSSETHRWMAKVLRPKRKEVTN